MTSKEIISGIIREHADASDNAGSSLDRSASRLLAILPPQSTEGVGREDAAHYLKRAREACKIWETPGEAAKRLGTSGVDLKRFGEFVGSGQLEKAKAMSTLNPDIKRHHGEWSRVKREADRLRQAAHAITARAAESAGLDVPAPQPSIQDPGKIAEKILNGSTAGKGTLAMDDESIRELMAMLEDGLSKRQEGAETDATAIEA